MSLATKSGKFSAREFKEWSRFLFCKEIGRALLFEMRGLSLTDGLPEPSGIRIWSFARPSFLEVPILQSSRLVLPFFINNENEHDEFTSFSVSDSML